VLKHLESVAAAGETTAIRAGEMIGIGRVDFAGLRSTFE